MEIKYTEYSESLIKFFIRNASLHEKSIKSENHLAINNNALVIANTLSNHTRDDSTHGHHQMVNTKIRLVIFFAAKMEKLYVVSKNKTGS